MLKKLNDAMDYIEQHLQEDFLLKDVSEHVNVSDYYLRKLFWALTNMTLSDYIKHRRLSEANKELLQHVSVTDVAYKYGYQSIDGFTRAFKKWSGILPSHLTKSIISSARFLRIIPSSVRVTLRLPFVPRIKSCFPCWNCSLRLPAHW